MRKSGFPFVLAETSATSAPVLPALQVQVLQLPASLATCISQVALVRNQARTLQTGPATGALLAFRLSGAVRSNGVALPALSLTGVQTRAREYEYSGVTISLLVRLTPQGGRCLGVPPAELTDTTFSVTDLQAGRSLVKLHEQLLEAPNAASALSALKVTFQALAVQPDPLVERARALLARVPAPRIATIASELGLSERQLERRFNAAIGVSPKRFASLLRFERALPVLNAGAGLAHVAQACGYFDQPHMAREIARFTGLSPARLRRQQLRTQAQVDVSGSYNPET
jgi:AraC-like DNA-binding protein